MVYNIGLGVNTGHGYTAAMNVDTRTQLDLTMSVPANNRLHNLNNFISSQTFHAPSFGDEDFELAPISLHSIPAGSALSHTLHNGYTNPHFSHANTSLSLTQPLSHHPVAVSSSCSIGGLHPNSHPQFIPKFPPQNIHIPDIMSMENGNSGHMIDPASILSMNSLNAINAMNAVNMNHVNTSLSSAYMTSPLTTISQSDLRSQLGIHSSMDARQGMVNHQGSPSGSSNTSPGRESSEESDDMLPLSQLALKRSAADQTPSSNANKKQKTPKKKKKKDPNEPQKPVSAYALFFRDTQAAIKGQNPSASFGEVSKIVASMWDSLDPEHKNMYKKKTETAKKEYLKQLAAYRASLVSQTGNIESQETGERPHPKPLLPNTMVNQVTSVPNPVTVTLTHLPPHTTAMSPPPHHQGQLMMSPLHPQSQPHPQQSIIPRPPIQQTMQAGSPHSVSMATSPVSMAASPVGMARSPIHMIDEQNMQSGMHLERRGPGLDPQCVRTGCQNQSLDSPVWDNDFCSNECVVSHCRDAFGAWVASRQGSNSYASVK